MLNLDKLFIKAFHRFRGRLLWKKQVKSYEIIRMLIYIACGNRIFKIILTVKGGFQYVK